MWKYNQVTLHRILICWYSYVNTFYIWISVIFLKITLHMGKIWLKLYYCFKFILCFLLHNCTYSKLFIIFRFNFLFLSAWVYAVTKGLLRKMGLRGWIIRLVLPFVALKLSIWISYYCPMNVLRTNRSVLALSIITVVRTQK